MRHISARHRVADDAGVITPEKTVERGAESVRAGEGELVNRERELAANLVDDLVADDGAHDRTFWVWVEVNRICSFNYPVGCFQD